MQAMRLICGIAANLKLSANICYCCKEHCICLHNVTYNVGRKFEMAS